MQRSAYLELLYISPAFVERRLRRSQYLQANERPTEIESLHDLDETCALVRQPILGRDHDVVEKDRTSADRLAAEIVVTQRRDARRVHRHEEGADAACAAFRSSGSREQHNGVGLVGHADRRLLTFQDIAVAIAPRGEREIGGV